MLIFDSSTTSTGYALFVSGELSRFDFLDFKNIKDSEKRIDEMIKGIYSIIDDIKPDIIVTEMTVVTRNAQAQRSLSMLLGAIRGKSVENDIYYHSFRPSEWRKLITPEKKPRKRDELKRWSLETVAELYNIKNINDDISDAILIGRAYINKFSK